MRMGLRHCAGGQGRVDLLGDLARNLSSKCRDCVQRAARVRQGGPR